MSKRYIYLTTEFLLGSMDLVRFREDLWVGEELLCSFPGLFVFAGVLTLDATQMYLEIGTWVLVATFCVQRV